MGHGGRRIVAPSAFCVRSQLASKPACLPGKRYDVDHEQSYFLKLPKFAGLFRSQPNLRTLRPGTEMHTFTSFDGTRITYHDEGNGPAAILLQGFGVDALGQFGEFERILPALEKRQPHPTRVGFDIAWVPIAIFGLGSAGENFLFPERPEPFFDALPGFLAVNAVAFLHAGDKHIPLTGNPVQVVFGQTSPPVPQGTSHLRPIRLQLIPVHIAIPFL